MTTYLNVQNPLLLATAEKHLQTENYTMDDMVDSRSRRSYKYDACQP